MDLGAELADLHNSNEIKTFVQGGKCRKVHMLRSREQKAVQNIRVVRLSTPTSEFF